MIVELIEIRDPGFFVYPGIFISVKFQKTCSFTHKILPDISSADFSALFERFVYRLLVLDALLFVLCDQSQHVTVWTSCRMLWQGYDAFERWY